MGLHPPDLETLGLREALQRMVLRGPADGWTIVSSRVVRTRFAIARDSGWRQEMVVRCRCLAG